MQISTLPHRHTFSVVLPPSISPEMVTISANKGEKLKVVADAWHVEDDNHYEWLISFTPNDVDMGSVHARFEGGRLTIEVGRRRRGVW
ncbi:hypothetical protein BJ165DRAFT_1353259 [Panaeolus papilionaceus]|nr:hypothetical protein BJ165DRAFT_1353259 [Panaeolus papilionaceus]